MFFVRNVALVICNASSLAVFHLSHIQYSDGGTTHAIDLGDEQAEPTCASSDDNNLVFEVDLTGKAEGKTPVDLAHGPADGNEGSVPDRDADRDLVPVHVFGAKAQGDHPCHKGMEESDVEDLEDEVDRKGREPRVALWWTLKTSDRSHGVKSEEGGCVIVRYRVVSRGRAGL